MAGHNKIKWVLFPFASVLFVFFFVGGPGYDSGRSFNHAWNMGHILFFAILTHLFISRNNQFSKKSLLAQLRRIIIFTLVLGIVIELVQYGFNRMPDFGDLWRNLIGSLMGLFFFNPTKKAPTKLNLRIVQYIIILLVLIELFPLAVSLTDEVIAARAFPVLADFESSIEVSRWTGSARFEIDKDSPVSGESSLKVTLGTSKYSGLSLKFFPNNWQGYRELRFSIDNTTSETFKILFRIHDRQHSRSKKRYNDRFNTIFLLSPGLNHISLDLAEVIQAPATREMDLSDIVEFQLFVMEMKASKVIRIDDFRLVK